MSWPMDTRCCACGTPGAIRLLDRSPGPWCPRCLPWHPVAPGWGPRVCRRCPVLGAVVLDNRGRRHGPFCREHVPAGWAFDAAADERLAERYREFESANGTWSR